MLNKLLFQSFLTIFASIYGFFIGFFVKIFLLNHVSITDYGKYIIGQTFTNTIIAIVSLSIPLVLTKNLNRYKNKNKYILFNNLINFSLLYIFFISFLIILTVIILNDKIVLLFKTHDSTMKQVIIISIFYIPFILFREMFFSTYRSMLKIKDIIIYGTLLYISVRAILILIFFSFFSNIKYLLFIEIFSLFIVDIILFSKLQKYIRIFIPRFSMITKDKLLIKFWRKIFFYSIVSFVGGYIINWELSILMPSINIGIYNILLTIAGLSAFIITNLAKIFAPIIAELVHKNEYVELEKIYKDATFLVSILTSCIIVFIGVFKEELLKLYSINDFVYTKYLLMLLIGYLINAFVGNSGQLLLMGNNEKKELIIRIINLLSVSFISYLLIKQLGLMGAVITFTISMIIVNLLQVYFVYKTFKFLPWNSITVIIFLITLLLITVLFFVKLSFLFKFYFYISYLLIIFLISKTKFIYIIKEIKRIKHAE